MTGKNIIYTLIASFVLALSACTSEDMSDSFDRTADGTIDFNVGVEVSPASRTITRSASPTYVAMQAGTQVRLKVDGVWNRKDPKNISQKTTCTSEATTSTVNKLLFSDEETLYWDDYGTGDPDNQANTDQGLRVLGVAVDGMSHAPEVNTESEWESLSWPVAIDGENVLNSDIIVSNNLKAYKFAERKDDEAKKMVFVHPLSKITFNITAGEGFTKGTIGATVNKFEKEPILWLTNATTLADIEKEANNYVLATGTVSIQKAVAESDNKTYKYIAGTTSTSNQTITVVKQAIVYPGTPLGASDNAVIAVLNADDNIYYIRAKEIREAMTKVDGHALFKTLPGYNYIINIKVNKTGARLTATVADWNEVNSDEVHPIINVDAFIGDLAGNASPEDFTAFTFWRSEKIAQDYQHEATLTGTPDGTTDWTFSNTLYWTHHNQHYHFRGIFPTTTAVTTDANGQQYVEVHNDAYSEKSFPSNFLMGMPEFSGKDYMCNNEDHDAVDMRIYGICARTSAINMNFRYMMSQVEVKLSSSETTADNYVDLAECQVELVNIGTEGHILLSDRSAVVMKDNQTYTLPGTSSTHYHGVIVPQALVNADKSNKVKFKITVYDDASHTNKDVYYADVAPVKVKALGASTSEAVTAWESGTHYVYNLKITKTEIKATASLTDWKTVEASEEVWF